MRRFRFRRRFGMLVGVAACVLLVSPLVVAPAARGEPPPPNEPDSTESPEPGASSAPAASAAPGEGAAPADTAATPRGSSSAPERKRSKPPTRLVEGMVAVAGGVFTMGSDRKSAEPNERPSHLVALRPFFIDPNEVTVRAWRACVLRGACSPPRGHGIACTYDRRGDDVPVNCVSWLEADTFCRAVGKRLPSEAEWEMAAGGGEPEPFFPWGPPPATCKLAVTLRSNKTGLSCAPGGPEPVGSRPDGATPPGISDMSGNVEEWVADWYADRYSAPSGIAVVEPLGPAYGVAHVLRGGGWMSRPRDSRVTARSWGSANEAGPNVGFRCARD